MKNELRKPCQEIEKKWHETNRDQIVLGVLEPARSGVLIQSEIEELQTAIV